MCLKFLAMMYSDFCLLLLKNLPDDCQKKDLLVSSRFSLVNNYQFSEADIRRLISDIKDYHSKTDLSRLDILINRFVFERRLKDLTVKDIFNSILSAYTE